jgi:ABC-2 type transport system permease protein
MNAQLKTFTWLVKREFWEHKGMLVWAPIVVAVLILVFLMATTAFMASGSVENYQVVVKDNSYSSNLTFGPGATLTEAERLRMTQATAIGVFGFIVPLLFLFAFTIFFYCLQSLHDERKDRSVLFWKSLPVSDGQTVLAKVFTAVVAAPFITLCVGLGISLLIAFFFAVVSSFAGEHSLWAMLNKSEFFMLPLYFISMLPVFAFWALPTVGWLMLVSVITRSSPFVWATSIPILIGLIAVWLNQFGDLNWDVKWYWVNIVGRGLGGVMPGSWYWPGDPSVPFKMGTPDAMLEMFALAWAQFQRLTMWVGVVAGLAMIYAAIRIRRWKDEGYGDDGFHVVRQREREACSLQFALREQVGSVGCDRAGIDDWVGVVCRKR